MCDKFDLSYVDQENLDERYKKFKLSLEEKEKEYEKFAIAAKKVAKGKPRPSVVTHENEKEPIVTIQNPKDINFKEINISIEELKEDKSSIISHELLKANEEKIKNAQKDIAKVLRETDVSIFLPTLISRYKIPKGAVRAGENNRVNFDFKNKDGSITTRNLTIIDYCTKQLNMRFGDAIDELTAIFNDQKLIHAAIPQNYKIKISVSDDFKLLLGSTKKKPKYQALNGWKTIEIEPSNLESTLKSYSAISMAVFKAGKRSNENIIGVNPLLIYDIDNSDNTKPQFTINDAVNTLSSKGVQGYIYPSASHLLDEKTQKFRLLIPTLNTFNYSEHKDTGYKIYMDNATKFLGLKDKVDEVYKTPSQLYYTPKKDTELIIVPGQVLDNSKIIKQSEYDIELAKEKEIIKQKGFEGILKDYQHAKNMILQNKPKDNEKYLTRISLQGLYDNVPIYDLMSYFDQTTKLIKEGSNTILHNKQGRHLYFKQENTAYLFKKNKHYTPYIYLVDRFNEAKQAIDERIYWDEIIEKLVLKPNELESFNPRNINEISKFFSRVIINGKKLWDKVTKINYAGIAANITRYLKDWDDKEGNENIKQHYLVEKFIKNSNTLQIGYLNNVSIKELRENGLMEWEMCVEQNQRVEFPKIANFTNVEQIKSTHDIVGVEM